MTVLVAAVTLLGIGVYSIVSVFRHHSYVQSLPRSPGNQQLRQRHYRFAITGACELALGLWFLWRYFN